MIPKSKRIERLMEALRDGEGASDSCKSKYVYKARGKEWLNDSFDEHGAVSWSVKAIKDNDSAVWADVRIQGCDDHIYLDFHYTTPRQLSGRINKVDVLIKQLEEFRNSLLESHKARQK